MNEAAEVLIAMGATGLCACGRDLVDGYSSIMRQPLRCSQCVDRFIGKLQEHIEKLHRCGHSFGEQLPAGSDSWWS